MKKKNVNNNSKTKLLHKEFCFAIIIYIKFSFFIASIIILIYYLLIKNNDSIGLNLQEAI